MKGVFGNSLCWAVFICDPGTDEVSFLASRAPINFSEKFIEEEDKIKSFVCLSLNKQNGILYLFIARKYWIRPSFKELIYLPSG